LHPQNMGIYSDRLFEDLLARPFDNRPRPANRSWHLDNDAN
jgi:hypothetical protein